MHRYWFWVDIELSKHKKWVIIDLGYMCDFIDFYLRYIVPQTASEIHHSKLNR